ncbi:MAG: cysteine--tRNA ligase [Candidatus Harrisonbacteria bacterium CG10_big_fil_rev_8_21_14_0_10_42_17]|uniref:Cysteine--tRNA ligase n=1 Tax=Candidatus Harrisonbacteria bacterium CG10_big_fil_rev_8_21_14_0_10_42_17 TaxID=1974584 RepID=A0A2M6WGY4_9BACT|nr:MAG: cysteine--tRNA ligase [Candidatus Harrisonbacteria bacterium CG10_big_fil_rev_8_21_14_0_10_42_17]
MKPTLTLYNTLTRLVQPFPLKKKLSLFVCGPTVYDFSHIGHARTYFFFDVFVRYLRFLGTTVHYVQNITDVDDKIIIRAKTAQKNPLVLARAFAKCNNNDMRALGIVSVDVYAPATQFIPQIVRQIQKLIKKDIVYEIPGDGYYFDISRFKNYGKLSRRTVLQAEHAVSRIDESINKRNKGDFAVWKLAKAPSSTTSKSVSKKPHIVNGEPVWHSPLGSGRPGWHIEDTAISEHYFGSQYDLHGGAVDLVFPHHEAEIALAESVSGKAPFVQFWIHTGFLTVRGEKMSKSLDNFITIRDFLKHHSARSLRFLFLQAHYRSPVDYADTLANDAETALRGIDEFLARLSLVARLSPIAKAALPKSHGKSYYQAFEEAMADDFNTPRAVAALFSYTTFVQKRMWKLSREEARSILRNTQAAFELLGIPVRPPSIPKTARAFARERELFRRSKQFTQADRLRKRVLRLGYTIEDTPLGSLILKNPESRSKN